MKKESLNGWIAKACATIIIIMLLLFGQAASAKITIGNIETDSPPGGCAIDYQGKCYRDIPKDCKLRLDNEKGILCGDVPIDEYLAKKKQR